MIELKTPGEIGAIRAAGRVVADVLAVLGAEAKPGVRPRDLDVVARDLIADAGAVSSFLGYHPRWAPIPYPAAICASVNDAVVHGIPGDDPLIDGDLLSMDLAVHLDGWCADAATSLVVGLADPRDLVLIDAVERALAAGTAAAVPGARLGDVACAIGAACRASRFGIMADHGGHGVGRSMHELPPVPNDGRPGRGLVLRPGLVVALEPMLLGGGGTAYHLDPDGWTLRTADGSRAAHAEHTIAVTEDGPRVLTAA